MAEPVGGSEYKIRGFEVAEVSQAAPDHVVNVDGYASGPAKLTPANFVGSGVDQMSVVPTSQLDGRQAFVPVSYVVDGAPQQGKADLQSVVAGAGSFYLGPKSEPPIADNMGLPLQPGHTYYNLSDETLYVWVSAGRWSISAASLPAAMRVYFYTFSIPSAIIPPNGANTPDSLGNILNFDVSAGQVAVSGVNVFINGVLLVNGVDYTVKEGGTAGDYIILTEEYCATSVVVVQVYSTGATLFSVNSVKIDTAGWVLNSDNRVFSLRTTAGAPVFPNNAVNCTVSWNNTILEPNVEFTINSDAVTFAAAPSNGDDLWMVVGVPSSGAFGESGPRITPWQFGGAGDGVIDDSAAIETAINAVNATKATLDLAGGTWRITRSMPDLLYPRVDGGGSGQIYVDYDMAGEPVLNCTPALGENYAVTGISQVLYDFEGAYSADTTVTRLTVALAVDQELPIPGMVGKVSSEDQIVGTEAGDNVGQHLMVLAVDEASSYIYCLGLLADAFTTNIEFRMLGREQVLLRNFGMRGNWDRVVAEDWLGTFIQVLGAYLPKVNDVWFSDGVQGLMLAGTFLASTRGIRVAHMRNATASETPAVPGYGVVDAGSYASYHADIGGYDCRHVYTTISPDAATWPRVAWGRAYRPKLQGGQAASCSAAAYDTHSDAYEPVFDGLQVAGAYYGQNSAGAGIQFRGVRGLARGCRVRGTPVGFEIYRQFVGEVGEHRIEDCSYEGYGTPYRVEREPTLSSVDAHQKVSIGSFRAKTSDLIGLDLSDCHLVIDGTVEVIMTANVPTPRAVYERAEANIASHGQGRLVYDFSAMAGTPNPRLITFAGPNCGADRLSFMVKAGAVAWQAVVSENDSPAATVAAGAFVLDGDCDLPPGSASGHYSQNGANNRLPDGSVKLRLTLNGARTAVVAKTSAFSVTASMHGSMVLCNGTFTVTIPAYTVLGPDFRCTLMSVVGGGTITLDGPGGSNPTVPAGSQAVLSVIGSAVGVVVTALTVI